MKANDSVLRMVGLAKRAGKVKLGANLAEQAVHNGSAQLAIVAADAAQNAKKRMKDACQYYGVEYIEYATKEDLAACVGKEELAALCIIDKNFAKGIKDKYRQSLLEDREKQKPPYTGLLSR